MFARVANVEVGVRRKKKPDMDEKGMDKVISDVSVPQIPQIFSICDLVVRICIAVEPLCLLCNGARQYPHSAKLAAGS